VTLESKVQQQWPIGINIDALVVLDFNADRVLASVEILIPFELWEHKNVSVPQGKLLRGALKLARPYAIPSSFSMTCPQLCIYNGRDQDCLLIFGQCGTRVSIVNLSDYCRAIISNDNLIGFVFDLPEQVKPMRFSC